ncbi:MAG: hypothetical protein KTR25_16970 [Myxococcales bacterium]|nr:hypothetical protein [Myxococcales bacterium]
MGVAGKTFIIRYAIPRRMAFVTVNRATHVRVGSGERSRRLSPGVRTVQRQNETKALNETSTQGPETRAEHRHSGVQTHSTITPGNDCPAASHQVTYVLQGNI